MQNDVMCVIPARYNSTRLPGKPLIDIGGKPMIVRTWERVRADLPAEQIIVATDDKRIARVCKDHEIRGWMTSPGCRTGTDRAAEVAMEQGGSGWAKDYIWVVAMGDNPCLPPGVIPAVVESLKSSTRRAFIGRAALAGEGVASVTTQKMAIDSNGDVLFVSRMPIPWHAEDYWQQVNVYAFRYEGLRQFASLPTGPNEEREKIEILRLLEHGISVGSCVVESDGGAVDVPADVDRARARVATIELPQSPAFTTCVSCKHMLGTRPKRNAVCLVSVHQTGRDPLTGEQFAYEDSGDGVRRFGVGPWRLCADVNDGNCKLYEPRGVSQ